MGVFDLGWSENGPVPKRAVLLKMSIAELKAELTARGMDCQGCTEKSEFVDAVEEYWRIPKFVKPTTPPPSSSSSTKSSKTKSKASGSQNQPQTGGSPNMEDLIRQVQNVFFEFLWFVMVIFHSEFLGIEQFKL